MKTGVSAEILQNFLTLIFKEHYANTYRQVSYIKLITIITHSIKRVME